jgi:hypothetical protein
VAIVQTDGRREKGVTGYPAIHPTDHQQREGMKKKNDIVVGENGVCRMTIKGGKIALFDVEDLEKMKDTRWSLDGSYVTTGCYQDDGRRVRMQNVIMNPPVGFVVDHIDHNPCNNQRKNLRIVTQWENMQNKKRFKSNKTGYRGVTP